MEAVAENTPEPLVEVAVESPDVEAEPVIEATEAAVAPVEAQTPQNLDDEDFDEGFGVYDIMASVTQTAPVAEPAHEPVEAEAKAPEAPSEPDMEDVIGAVAGLMAQESEPAAAVEPEAVEPKKPSTAGTRKKKVAKVKRKTEEPEATGATEEFLFDGFPSLAAAQDEAVNAALSAACQRLEADGAEMLKLAEGDAAALLDFAAMTLEWLAEHFGHKALPDADVLERMRSLIQDADDLVQLLRIEGDAQGAADAVGALLQLKRSIQSELAAASD